MINTAPTLSVLIPTYNEAATIGQLLKHIQRIRAQFDQLQVIVIDDGSTDQTAVIAQQFSWVVYYQHPHNRGKTAAIRTGLARARNHYVLIQDADLEYSPKDWLNLLQTAIKNQAPVVYGSRRLHHPAPRSAAAWFYLGGMSVNHLTNWLYHSQLTDVPTGYKLFERSLLQSLPLKHDHFEFCPEVTARLLKLGIPIIEVPIDYQPRSVAEGKKIGWRDFWSAIWVLIAVKLELI